MKNILQQQEEARANLEDMSEKIKKDKFEGVLCYDCN